MSCGFFLCRLTSKKAVTSGVWHGKLIKCTLTPRWQQRFQNFDRAFTLLKTALEERPQEKFNQLELEGLIQRFKYTFELAWKTLKDYLDYEGLVLSEVTHRAVLKAAFATKIIDEGQTWIEMLAHRNLMSHTYDCDKFEEAVTALRTRYLGLFDRLHSSLAEKRK